MKECKECKMSESNQKYYMRDIKRLLKKSVIDEFECEGCNNPLESDAEYCGLCGWINPLVKGGYI